MKIKNFIKENYKFIIVLILIVLFCTIRLPYYIMTTGGTINITDRVEMDGYQKEDKGSINMLYVSEYDATPFSYLLAKLRGEEINSNKERQISNESVEEINKRNKIMRDNSLDIAVLVAYQGAGKNINIKSKKNIVMAKTTDNNFEVGDIILTVNDKLCDELKDIKEEILRIKDYKVLTLNKPK